jgi:superfamily II DNA or RNA helicase
MLGVSPSKIGILKGGKCNWHGKTIVVAVVHSLCKGRMGVDFHQHFGIAIWDEAHRMASKWFSKSLLQVLAKYRIALTATPNRKDGRTKLLHLAFDEPNSNVTGNTLKALPCTAYVVHTRCTAKSPNWGNTTMKLGRLLSDLAVDSKRNALITKLVRRGYAKGRNILVLSDRIEQLRLLMKSLDGVVPKNDMGLFISATSEARQNEIKDKCRIIFATYGMMKEGQDIPRLDMGIDATPRSDGNQAVGRIRRELAGKKKPLWVTLFDAKASALLQGISSSRIKDYKSCGVEVITIAEELSAIMW